MLAPRDLHPGRAGRGGDTQYLGPITSRESSLMLAIRVVGNAQEKEGRYGNPVSAVRIEWSVSVGVPKEVTFEQGLEGSEEGAMWI